MFYFRIRYGVCLNCLLKTLITNDSLEIAAQGLLDSNETFLYESVVFS